MANICLYSNDEEPDTYSSDFSKDALSNISFLSSPAMRQRLAARSLEIKMCQHDENDGDFVPPKELLLYLVRMGSFSSTPKILNGDTQDNDVHVPEGISRQELIQYCQKQQRHPLIKRAFRKAFDSKDSMTYALKFKKLNSVSKGCSDFTSNPSSIRVFQWNVLSQALGQMNDNFARCPDEALEWNNRRFQIVEEIVEYCPDVICLQEVDHFNFLKNILASQGYCGMFYPKPDSPCFYIDGNNGPDGCAIFFRRNKFDLIKSECRILEIWRVQSNQVAILALLRLKETGQEICIVTTHLKARNGTLLSTLRNEQGKDLLQFVSSHCGDRPIVMCGDFNAEPTEPIYDTILNSSLNFSSAYAQCNMSLLGRVYSGKCESNLRTHSTEKDFSEEPIENMFDTTVSLKNNSHNPCNLPANEESCQDKFCIKDSPKQSSKKEPPYTTWKIRDEGEVCHTIDYVFYSGHKIHVDAVLELPTAEEIGEDRVPSFAYPSDHFSLCCDFKFGYSSSHL